MQNTRNFAIRHHQFPKPWVIIPLGALLLVFLYCVPLEKQLLNGHAFSRLSETSNDSWQAPYLRTFAFAGITVLLEGVLGFYGAVLLSATSRSLRRFLPLLLLPALSGAVSIAFVWKLNIMQHGFLLKLIADRGFVGTWGLLLTIQLWQYVPLFIYLFYLRFEEVQRNQVEFAAFHHLTLGERIRDLYWPTSRYLASFLVLFGYILGIQEYAKFQLILRASAGTGTELATERIARYYDYFSMADPSRATQITLSYAALFLLLAVISAALAVIVVTSILAATARTLGTARVRLYSVPGVVSNTGVIFIILFLCLPIVALIPYFRPNLSLLRSSIPASVGFALSALALVIAISVSSAIIARLFFRNALSRFTRRSLLFFLSMLSITFIPPIATAFCAYYWLAALRTWLESARLSFSAMDCRPGYTNISAHCKFYPVYTFCCFKQ